MPDEKQPNTRTLQPGTPEAEKYERLAAFNKDPKARPAKRAKAPKTEEAAK